MKTGSHLIKKIVLASIVFYQRIFSPQTGIAASFFAASSGCRFYPTCSQYTYEAIEQYGVFKGVRLAGRRLMRCHPYHEGGIDLVP